jgi:DNA uptake protein ComE-like DNA-binding protein
MRRLIWLILLAGVSFNCGEAPGTSSQEEEPVTKTEEVSNTKETATKAADASEAIILNPNLASKEELLALSPVNEELAERIIESRPFLNMKDFHQLFAEILDAEAMEAFFSTCFVPLNLNTASEEEFLMVPRVGKKMAHEFEEYRPYKKIAQFRREMGKYVDDAEIAHYEKFVFVPIALNSATEEEILALPGVGKKMAHEFEEYRPYKSIEQFRREIGKYVDEKELARLERLVYLDESN